MEDYTLNQDKIKLFKNHFLNRHLLRFNLCKSYYIIFHNALFVFTDNAIDL